MMKSTDRPLYPNGCHVYDHHGLQGIPAIRGVRRGGCQKVGSTHVAYHADIIYSRIT